MSIAIYLHQFVPVEKFVVRVRNVQDPTRCVVELVGPDVHLIFSQQEWYELHERVHEAFEADSIPF